MATTGHRYNGKAARKRGQTFFQRFPGVFQKERLLLKRTNTKKGGGLLPIQELRQVDVWVGVQHLLSTMRKPILAKDKATSVKSCLFPLLPCGYQVPKELHQTHSSKCHLQSVTFGRMFNHSSKKDNVWGMVCNMHIKCVTQPVLGPQLWRTELHTENKETVMNQTEFLSGLHKSFVYRPHEEELHSKITSRSMSQFIKT